MSGATSVRVDSCPRRAGSATRIAHPILPTEITLPTHATGSAATTSTTTAGRMAIVCHTSPGPVKTRPAKAAVPTFVTTHTIEFISSTMRVSPAGRQARSPLSVVRRETAILRCLTNNQWQTRPPIYLRKKSKGGRFIVTAVFPSRPQAK